MDSNARLIRVGIDQKKWDVARVGLPLVVVGRELFADPEIILCVKPGSVRVSQANVDAAVLIAPARSRARRSM